MLKGASKKVIVIALGGNAIKQINAFRSKNLNTKLAKSSFKNLKPTWQG